jgi:phosphoribosylformylglycinamidine synthase subunit PurS
MKARIHITLKKGVLDPQGKAIANALSHLGFEGVEEVRQGKYIEIDFSGGDAQQARARLDAMCEQLLANTVIENYSVELDA